MCKIVDGLICEYDGCWVLVIFFIKGGGLWLELMVEVGVEVLGLDWICDIGSVWVCVGECVVL